MRGSGRVFVIALGCGLLSGLADELPATPQWLRNGGFEAGEGTHASEWGLWPPPGRHAGVSSERDHDERHSGACSGRLRVTAPAFDGICTWHHPAVAVRPGTEVVLSFWVKAEGVSGQCGCDVQLRHGPTEIVGSRATESRKGSFGWRQVVHRFVVPEGTDHLCVVPFLRGQGTVWFDDVAAYGVAAATVARVTSPPTVDGRLDEPCWAAAAPLSGFLRADGASAPQRSTSAWIVHDHDRLFVAFRCRLQAGDTLTKRVTVRDGDVWQDDDVEVFIDPRGDGRDYYQFVVNPRGTRYDSRRTDRQWDCDWQAATQESAGEWTVEMAIPLAGLSIDLQTRLEWGVNLCRADKAGGEVSAWSCPFGGFHTPGRFGRLRGLQFDFVPFYLRDAAARVAAVRRRYADTVAGLDAAVIPAALAAPFVERDRQVRQTLAELAQLLSAPQAVTQEQWAGVPSRVADVETRVEQLRPAALRQRAFIAWNRANQPPPAFGLALASPMEKVFRDGHDLVGEVGHDLRLSAAAGECESAQVVVVSLSAETVPGCRATVTPFVGPEEHRGSGVPALDLKVVGYIRTGTPKYPASRVGEWPDPLLPNRPFDLPAGCVQPLWVRVAVPAGTPPGDYRATATITGGGTSLTLPVVTHVFAFGLPQRQHLATPVGCAPEEISQWYTGSTDYHANLPPEVFMRWNRFLLDYRLTPTRVGQAYLRTTCAADGSVAYDYSITDRCLADVAARLPPRGVNLAGVGDFGWRSANGAALTYTEDDAHAGRRAGRCRWPRTSSWASLSRGLPAARLAERSCSGFRFWLKALSGDQEAERVVAFINAGSQRWLTTFAVGATDWHEVHLPLTAYHHNQTGVPLTLADLAGADSFQFVIDHKDRALEFLVDDIAGVCADGELTVDDFELAGEFAGIRSRVQSHLDHWRRKGWLELGHVYGWDEARPDEYPQVVAAYREVLDVAPGALIMQTYYTNRTPAALVGAVRIWCALTANYDAGFLEARRAAGNDVWLYVCCGPTPPYANFFIDQPGIAHRLLFWQAWQRHCTGVLYWRANYWHGLLPREPGTQRWPDQAPWDCSKLATYREFKVNGDGWLVCPGREWEPLPSVRLESIRDGVEDFEYLCLLRERRPDHPLLTVGDDLSADLTHFCQDPRVLERRRQALAEAIEAAR